MNVYTHITNLIIEQLEQGTVPWQKPWSVEQPKNLVSDKPYRGVNALLLGMTDYECEYWATFRQINAVGGSVKRGSKATTVIYSNWMKVGDVDTEEKLIPFLRSYKVFNLQQTDGIEIPRKSSPPLNRLAECESIWENMPNKPELSFDGGSKAFYRPSSDSIHLPKRDSFKSSEAFYSTLFHEMAHSTGHTTRLDRKCVNESVAFGSDNYAQEELVAEIGAAFLCGKSRIEKPVVQNQSAYIQGWLKTLKSDRRMVVISAAQAQKAVDYICGEV